jgi:hypothetical protein
VTVRVAEETRPKKGVLKELRAGITRRFREAQRFREPRIGLLFF